MNETYNQLAELSTLYRGNGNMNEIAMEYQDTEDAILLSYAHCKNWGLTWLKSEKFFGLTEDDVQSFALEEMHKAMLHFSPTGGAKLQTLYVRFLTNRLRTETQSLNYDKRKSNSMTESMEEEFNDMSEHTASSSSHMKKLKLGYEESTFKEIELLMSLAENEELSENEYKYCEIIVSEVSHLEQVTDSDIAKRLNISSAAVHYIKKSLQKKLTIRSNNNYALNI